MPYRRRMRFLSLAVAAGLTLALGACGPQPQPPMPTPSPTTTPFFASDEEALAAAEEVYREYKSTAAEILAEGGKEPDRIRDYVTGQFLDESLDSFATARSNDWRTIGDVLVKDFALEFYDSSSSGPEVIAALSCEDVSAVDVVDAAGSSVVREDRPALSTFSVIFDLSDGDLKISSRTIWSVDPC